MASLVTFVQYVLGIYFLFAGVVHFIVPDGLPGPMTWMYDLAPLQHWLSGSAEILAAGTLLLAGRVDRLKSLVPFASAGLVLVMILAALWHSLRGEDSNVTQNIVLGLAAGFVSYGRWWISPYQE